MKNIKRMVSLFLSGIILFSLVSCGLTDNIKNKMTDSDLKNTFSYAVNNGNVELFKVTSKNLCRLFTFTW